MEEQRVHNFKAKCMKLH